VARYLYTLRATLCRCGHESAKHKIKCYVEGCECSDLKFEEYETEADRITDAAENLNKKLDDVVYVRKVKL
jgi:hypothetical protein